MGNTDTLLDDPQTFSDKTYTFAPGEGQQSLSLYQEPDAEFFAFPYFVAMGELAMKIEKLVCTIQM